jgi:hypothetical protein
MPMLNRNPKKERAVFMAYQRAWQLVGSMPIAKAKFIGVFENTLNACLVLLEAMLAYRVYAQRLRYAGYSRPANFL